MIRPALPLAICLVALTGCHGTASVDPMTSTVYSRAVTLLQTQAHSRELPGDVRSNCIEALQSSHDPRALDVIEEGLHDDVWVVRFASAMASGKRKATRMRPVLESLAVNDVNGSVRVASIYALRRMGQTAHMSDLAVALASPDPETRANTALVLGMLGDPSAIPLLESRRNDPDVRVKFEITAALARLGDEQAQKIIIAGVINKFAEDHWLSMMVCADLPPLISNTPLLAGLQEDPGVAPPGVHVDETVINLTKRQQLVAARSLAKQRNGSGAKIALEGIKNPDPNLRGLALLALGEMLTPQQAPGLERYLADPDDNVRRAAAAAIVNIFSRADKSP